MTVTRKGKKTH